MGSWRPCFHQHQYHRAQGLALPAEWTESLVRGRRTEKSWGQRSSRRREAARDWEAQPGKFSRGGRAFKGRRGGGEEGEAAGSTASRPRGAPYLCRGWSSGLWPLCRQSWLSLQQPPDRQELASTGPCNFSLIVPRRSEPGFQCLKGRNQDGCFLYSFLLSHTAFA